MVSLTQFRDRLEDRRGKDDKMSKGVWKTVETNAGKIGVAETKGERGKRRSRKGTRKKRGKEEAKKRKNGRSKKGSGRMENLKQEKGNSKVRSKSKEVSTREVS